MNKYSKLNFIFEIVSRSFSVVDNYCLHVIGDLLHTVSRFMRVSLNRKMPFSSTERFVARSVIYSLLLFGVFLVSFYCSGDAGTKGVDGEPLAEVQGFSLVPGHRSIIANWKKLEGATHYDVYMDGDLQGSIKMPDGQEKGYMQMTTLVNGKKYDFMMQAKNENGLGKESEIISAIPRPNSLSPLTLVGSGVESESTSATLKWNEPDVSQLSNPEKEYVTYNIYRFDGEPSVAGDVYQESNIIASCPAMSSEPSVIFSSEATCKYTNDTVSLVNTNLANGQKYTYAVRWLFTNGKTVIVESGAGTLAIASPLAPNATRPTVSVTDIDREAVDGAVITLLIMTTEKPESYNICVVVAPDPSPDPCTDASASNSTWLGNVPAGDGESTSYVVTKKQHYGITRAYTVFPKYSSSNNLVSRAITGVSSPITENGPIPPTIVGGVTATGEKIAAGDHTVTVMWAHRGDTRATSYTVEEIKHSSTDLLTSINVPASDCLGGSCMYLFSNRTDGNYDYNVTPKIAYRKFSPNDAPISPDPSVVGVIVSAAPLTLTSIIVTPFDPLKSVDTFIGIGNVSGAHSSTLDAFSRVVPAASRPFGLVRVSPVNSVRTSYFWGASWRLRPNWGTTPYFEHNPDNIATNMLVHGFAMNSLSGPGCPVKFDFPFMVTPGANITANFKARKSVSTNGSVRSNGRKLTGYRVKRIDGSYQREGKPGYLKYHFKDGNGDPGMVSEFTATRRAGIGKFTFGSGDSRASAIFTSYTNSNRSDNRTDSNIAYNSSTGEIRGVLKGGEFCNPGSNEYKIFMVAKLDQSIIEQGSIENNREHAVVVALPSTKVIHVKFALSYTSFAGARNNLGEISNFDFDGTKSQAEAEWSALLSSVVVKDEARDSDKRIFYTALWRMFQHPTIYQDKDGSYRGFDNNVHNIREHTTPRALNNMYTDFSGWDVYRFQTQLLAFLLPEAASDMAQSLTVQAEQSKMAYNKSNAAFPRWTVGTDDALMMHGNPGQIIVANMYTFGATNFDIEKVWNFSKPDDSRNDNTCSSNYVSGCASPMPEFQTFIENENPENPRYRKGILGTGGASFDNPSSKTLEYTTAEFAKAQIAKAIYDRTPTSNISKKRTLEEAYNKHIVRAGRWREVIRNNGSALNLKSGSNFYEGTAEQYRWVVPYDGKALMKRATTQLNRLTTHANGFRNATDGRTSMYMGNQVCLATPWLFNYAKKPTLTQKYVREVMETLYTDAIDRGIPGNDDLGTLSGWYVSAALGLAPTIPGVPVFLIHTPFFADVTIQRLKMNLGDPGLVDKNTPPASIFFDGKIKIKADAPKTKKYIASLTLKKGNSSPANYDKSYIKLSDMIGGAELEFSTAVQKTGLTWATSDASVPPSATIDTTGQYGMVRNSSAASGLGRVNHRFSLPPPSE